VFHFIKIDPSYDVYAIEIYTALDEMCDMGATWRFANTRAAIHQPGFLAVLSGVIRDGSAGSRRCKKG
jgi:hypothetical protein